MPLRDIFKATEPSDMEAAQRRLALAQALQQRSLQPNVPAAGGAVQARYTPGNALIDLANALASAWGVKRAESAYDRAKTAKQAAASEALKKLIGNQQPPAAAQAPPQAQTGNIDLDTAAPPQLPASGPASASTYEQSIPQAQDAINQGANPDLVSALLSQRAPKPPMEVSAGATLYDPNSKSPVFTAPREFSPPKRNVEWKDVGDKLVPVYGDTGEDVPGLQPKAKAPTPAQQANNTDGLSESAKQLAVDRLLAGEKSASVLGNLGRGQQGARDLRSIQNLLADTAKKRNISGPKLVKLMQSTAADGRAILELGAREGKIAARVQEAQNFAIVAKDASAAVPRGSFMPWNRLKQMTETQLSDPSLAKLKAATNSLINAYAGAVGGGVMHVHDQEQAEKLLSSAQSPEAYGSVVDQLILETEKALEAPGQVRERMTGVAPQDGADVKPTSEADAALLKKWGGR